MAYKDPTEQGTTKFAGKIWDKQIAQADADQKVLGGNKGTREIGDFIENLDGNPCEDRSAGKPAALPKRSK